MEGFDALLLRSLAIIAAVVVTNSLSTFLCGRLSVMWRSLLVQRLHRLYFHDFALYQVNHLKEYMVENP